MFMALCSALFAFVLVPIPKDLKRHPTLPDIALGQVGIYRLEVALLVFYGELLVATPAFSGLVRGRLPIEISTRGARFAEEADQSADLTDTAIRELRQTTNNLIAKSTAANLEIKLMKKAFDDNTQPGVPSNDD